jgi:hypothetical protein
MDLGACVVLVNYDVPMAEFFYKIKK